MTTHGTSLQSLYSEALKTTPDKVAVISNSETLTYSELNLKVQRIAGGLRHHGIKPGDRVAWLLANGAEALLTTLACYHIGAIAVPLNHRYVFDEAKDVLDRTAARLLIYDGGSDDVVSPLSKSNPDLMLCCVGQSRLNVPHFDTLANRAPQTTCEPVAPETPALILFTSGSTGRPKGVVHSHAGAFFAIDVSRQVFQFNSNDVVLVGKPISHAGGLQTQMMPTLQAGGRVVLAMKPAPVVAASLIRQHSVTEYGLLASDLLDFVEHLESEPTELPSLENAIGSGDSVPTDLHQRFRDLFGWEVMEGAGMTEVGGYYAANPRSGKRKWGSLGLPTPGTSLRIVDASGRECDVKETGELVLQSKSDTIGYWKNEAATQNLYRNGWLQTGDLGYRDEDGYIWFVGRKKLMIIRRGSNIAPAEVENVLDQHPLVHASVLVGVDDRHEGQIPVACVALLKEQTESSESALRDFVSQHLAAYKNPVHYLFLKELPRTGTGKFDRHQLLQIAKAQLGESAD